MSKDTIFPSLKLSPNEKDALLEIKERLLDFFNKRIETIVLFGSKARGTALPYSDIDLLVLLDKEDFKSWEKIQEFSSKLSLKHDVFLSVKVMDKRHFQYLRSIQTGFALNLEKEGVKI